MSSRQSVAQAYHFHCQVGCSSLRQVNEPVKECRPAKAWEHKALMLENGKMQFATADFAPGISLTQSRGCLHGDFHSSVAHDEPVAILAFGLGGQSHYRIGRSGPTSLLKQNDIWLYRPDDEEIFRHTPAQDDSWGVALKFTSRRIVDVLAEIDAGGEMTMPAGHRAMRFNGPVNVYDLLKPLIQNPMQSALDKISAESTALSILADCLEARPLSQLLCGEHHAGAEHKSLLKVIDMLMSDLSAPPDLSQLAVEAGMSHTRLNRCFKKTFGCTVFVWLRQHRLELSKVLLRKDQQSITEIAYSCGFSSSSHFGAAFKAEFGCTPQYYRCGHLRKMFGI